jgi:hypothetical protein
MAESSIAQLLQQIDQEYRAAQLGLTGLASGTARHDFITARTENLGVMHEQLIELVGPEKAIALVANTIWSSVDQKTAQNKNTR